MIGKLSDELEDKIVEYYAHDAAKITSMIDQILKKFGRINDPSHFYSLANEVFCGILLNYDGTSDFDAFAYSCFQKKICSEVTRNNREKRMPYERNEKGEKVLDEDGEPIRIPILSLDALSASTEDGTQSSFVDLIADDYCLEDEVLGESTQRLESFFKKLSKKQKKMAKLMIDGYEPDEILEKLKISKEEYNDNVKKMKSYDMISVFFRK